MDQVLYIQKSTLVMILLLIFSGTVSAQQYYRNQETGMVPGAVSKGNVQEGRPSQIRQGNAGLPVPINSGGNVRHPVPVTPGEGAVRPLPFPPPTPQQQAATNQILKIWEKFSTEVNTFEADFTRYRYIISFENVNEMQTIKEVGKLHYASPDRGAFIVMGEDGKTPVEKWICDGESIYEYKYRQNEIERHFLPAEMRGKAITSGPLPFLFGATSAELQKRYYIRQIAPPDGKVRQGMYWLEAWPKMEEDAADFKRAEIIIVDRPDVRPLGIKLHKTNSEQHSYAFNMKEIKVNKLRFFPETWKPSMGELRKMKLIEGER